MKLNRCKKGFTLLETIIAMSISTMLLIIATTIFVSTYVDKYKLEKEHSYKLSIENAKVFLEGQSLKSNIIQIDDKDGCGRVLVLKYQDDLKKNQFRYKEVFVNNEKLAVKTYTTGYFPNTSNTTYLVEGINQFKINKKENLIYLQITSNNGITEEICIVDRGMLY